MIKNNTLRPAIAMIELIFAIVIMGIVMMSAPMLISTANQSGYVTIQQEAINEASSQVNMMMSYPWDEENVNIALPARVLRTTAGNAGLDAALPAAPSIPDRRTGTPPNSQRKFIDSTGVAHDASFPLGLELGEVAEDDLDDFDATAVSLAVFGAATTADTIQQTNEITITRNVAYNIDNTLTFDVNNLVFVPFTLPPAAIASPTTNIKEITVNIQSTDAGAANEVTELAKNITLRAFSCNIGTYRLEER